jgi:hypothetical protein
MVKRTGKKSPPKVELGSLVRDTITGFTGIVVGRTEFAYGCIHIRVQAKRVTKEGEAVAVQSFDDQRVELLEPPTKAWPKPKDTPIKLGDIVCDGITGQAGVATARCIDLDGRVSFIVEQAGVTEEGEPKDAFYRMSDRLEVLDKRPLKVSATSAATSGGPMCRGTYVE